MLFIIDTQRRVVVNESAYQRVRLLKKGLHATRVTRERIALSLRYSVGQAKMIMLRV